MMIKTEIEKTLNPTRENRDLISALRDLGKLPHDFPPNSLVRLLQHSNTKIRLLAIKNIGKLKNSSLIDTVDRFAKNELDTLTRREAVSALGRMRSEKAISALIRFLSDPDPKIILQAIRGLIYFKDLSEVRQALNEIADHPNEMIQELINPKCENDHHEPHSHSQDLLKNAIVHADALETLKKLPD